MNHFTLDTLDDSTSWSPMSFGKSLDSGLLDSDALLDEVGSYNDLHAAAQDDDRWVELSFDF